MVSDELFLELSRTVDLLHRSESAKPANSCYVAGFHVERQLQLNAKTSKLVLSSTRLAAVSVRKPSATKSLLRMIHLPYEMIVRIYQSFPNRPLRR
jgi:hypothetical protein